MQDGLWEAVKGRAKLSFRGTTFGVTLTRPGGETVVATSGEPMAVLTGEPAELLLYLFGRRDHARVRLSGPPEALEQLAGARSTSDRSEARPNATRRMRNGDHAAEVTNAEGRGQRTVWPASRRASLTWPIRKSPKWKTLAASTASAPAVDSRREVARARRLRRWRRSAP